MFFKPVPLYFKSNKRGCCISKWRTKKRSIECYHYHIHVVDRLAIPPKTPKISIPVSNKISPSPPSPTTISSCSSLSSGSSILSSKDRSFSNEFFWSCVKENPHTIRSSSSKKRSQLLVSPNMHAEKLDLPPKQVVEPVKQSIPQKVNTSTTPHKRVRSNSPTTLTRQKSFRREQDRFNSSHSLPIGRTLRSPSPGRRFNGDNGRGILTAMGKESHSKRKVGTVLNSANSVSSSLRKEKLGLTSSYINSSQPRSCLRNRETCIHRTSSKIDEVAVDEALAHQGNDSIPMEDIDNPLISLDCFIFL